MMNLKYNSATVHITGLAIRTEAGNGEYDSRWSYNHCATLTRSRNLCTAKGEYTTATEALKNARSLAVSLNKKVCKSCTAAAEAMIETEAAEAAAAQVAENVELCASNSNAKGMHYRAVGGQVSLCAKASTSRKPNARQLADNKVCAECAAHAGH